MLKYSNGWGHLIMSVVIAIIALIMILMPVTDAGTKAVGIGFLTTVVGAWFVPNAAKQVIKQVVQQMPKEEGPDGRL
jgi:hypothetical protein